MTRAPEASIGDLHFAVSLRLLGNAVLLACFWVAAAHARPAPVPLAPYARLAAGAEGRELLLIARRALESNWLPRARPDSARAIAWPGPPAGVYVSLLRGRETRACVGSAAPLRGTLAETVRALAVEALRADPRRPAVRRDEVDALRIVISFVHEAELVASPMSVDPGREGLLITSPRGAVAFLPGEARTVRWALGEARRVGVLQDGRDDASFRRLDVVTLTEPVFPPAQEEPDAMD